MKVEALTELLEKHPNHDVMIQYPDNGTGFYPVTGLVYHKNMVYLFADKDDEIDVMSKLHG